MDLLFAATGRNSNTIIPLPSQAFKALKDREAKEKGTFWLSEVSSADVELFLEYATWAHVYEGGAKPVTFAPNSVIPSQEPSIASEADVPEKLSSEVFDSEDTSHGDKAEQKPQAFRQKQPQLLAAKLEQAQKTKQKARLLEGKHENLCTLRSGLSAKLVLMMLDMACHLLQDLEDSIEDQRPFVNAVRALVLTYRFEKPHMRRKIIHLRHVTCTRIVNLLDLKLRDQTLAETQLAFRDGFSKMDPSLLLEREWNAWIQRFLPYVMESEHGSDGAAVPVTAELDETVLAITGLEPPVVYKADSAVDIRDQSLKLIKRFVKDKMKDVHKIMAYGMDELLMRYAEAKFAPNTAKAALPMNEEMVHIVDEIHGRLLKAVTQDVSEVVDLLGDIMTLK